MNRYLLTLLVLLIATLPNCARGDDKKTDQPSATDKAEPSTSANAVDAFVISQLERAAVQSATSNSGVVSYDWQVQAIEPGQLVGFVTTTHGNTLGVEVAAVDAALCSQLGLDEGKGVVVTSVVQDSEAAKAGLKQHDIVLAIDDQPIESVEKFNELIGARSGQKVNLRIVRQGKSESLAMTLQAAPVFLVADVSASLANVALHNQYRIGVMLSEADDTLRSQLRLASGEGLVVTDVVADSPAAKAGLRKHDVLVKLDGKRLSTVENLNAQVQEIKDRQVAVALYRGGKELTIEVAPQLSTQTAAVDYPTTNGNILVPTQLNQIQYMNRLFQPNQVLNRWDTTLYQPSVQWMTATGNIAQTQQSPTAQLAEVKKQLAEVQQAIAALEASLAAAANQQQQPQQQQPAQPQQQPQPEQPKQQPQAK